MVRNPLPSRPPELPAAARRRLLRIARTLADEVGTAVARTRRRSAPRVRRKAEGDFVTDADVRAERRLRRRLAQLDPEAGFVGEESAPDRPEAERVWVVDPIDGTSNFACGLPIWAVSVACMHRGWPVATAVHCQPEGALYSAALGLGAFRNGRRLRIPPGRLDDGAMLGCQWHRGAQRLPFLARLQSRGGRIRNLGCSVVHLCEVAAGHLDANVQAQGRLWDIAGAALVVLEAGGKLTRWDGAPVFPLHPADPDHHPTLAAAPTVHRKLLRLLRPPVSGA